jgi:hypothetical protein
LCAGGADRIAPPEDRLAFEREMTAAGADWRLTVYGGVGHSFTNPDIDSLGWDGFAYDAAADARSRRATLDLLQETIGLPCPGYDGQRPAVIPSDARDPGLAPHIDPSLRSELYP